MRTRLYRASGYKILGAKVLSIQYTSDSDSPSKNHVSLLLTATTHKSASAFRQVDSLLFVSLQPASVVPRRNSLVPIPDVHGGFRSVDENTSRAGAGVSDTGAGAGYEYKPTSRLRQSAS